MSATTTTMTVRVRQWLALENNLVSRELEGEVVRQTAKAVRFRGTAVVRRSDYCLRCGREIRNPVSRLAGYGPECSEKLGIPRDFTEADIEAIREAVKRLGTVEFWMPRGAFDITEGDLPDPEPEQTGATVRVASERIEAVTPFAAKDIVKAVPGARWDGAAKVWHWPLSEATAHDLVRKLEAAPVVGTVELDDAVRALLDQAAAGVAAATNKVADEDDVPDVPLPANGQPPHWIHQRRAFHAARGQSAYMLAIGMGGGKSRVAVDLVRDTGDARVLILCPKNVVGVWPKQFRLYSDIEYAVCAPRKGTVAKRAEEVQRALASAEALDQRLVVVVNFESAWREALAKVLLNTPWDRVILDESHRIKAPGGKASRFCAQLRPRSRRRLCLTGTPTPHSPLDVYAQYRFLDPGVFGTSFVKFRSRYAIMGGYGGHEVLGYQREQELAERMYSIAYRIADEELDAVLGLEEPIHETRTFALSPKGRKVYHDLWATMVTQVESGEVTAANALARLLRLAQVTSGYLPVDQDDGDRVLEVVDTAKRDELADLLEDIPPGEQVVVFCRFTQDLDNVEHVAAQLGRSYAELSGRRRDALTDDSTLAPGVAVAGVQIQAGGVGIDFSASHYCVFYSVGFSLGDYDQALKRTHRPGQEHRVTYYHLVAEDSVDEYVYSALRERKDVIDYVLGLAR